MTRPRPQRAARKAALEKESVGRRIWAFLTLRRNSRACLLILDGCGHCAAVSGASFRFRARRPQHRPSPQPSPAIFPARPPLPSDPGTISFYDPVLETVVEVATTALGLALAPGQPPRLVLVGPLFTSASLPLTPTNRRLLRCLLKPAPFSPAKTSREHGNRGKQGSKRNGEQEK